MLVLSDLKQAETIEVMKPVGGMCRFVRGVKISHTILFDGHEMRNTILFHGIIAHKTQWVCTNK